jgi:cell wall-associated NlpC family hydrolase
MAGFDCSGLVVEVLQSVGLLPHKADFTAAGLWTRFTGLEVQAGAAGCLVFWFNNLGLATHVEMMLDGSHTIGASGGGSATTSLEEAIRRNAFVKMRPVGYRGAGYRILDPFKGA